MKKDELAEILATHADALIEGRDISAQFLAHFPEQSAELSSLFQLASSIRSALTPVSSPDFRSRLQRQLTDYTPSGPITITPTARPKMVWLVAAAGSALIGRWPGHLGVAPLPSPGEAAQLNRLQAHNHIECGSQQPLSFCEFPSPRRYPPTSSRHPIQASIDWPSFQFFLPRYFDCDKVNKCCTERHSGSVPSRVSQFGRKS